MNFEPVGIVIVCVCGGVEAEANAKAIASLQGLVEALEFYASDEAHTNVTSAVDGSKLPVPLKAIVIRTPIMDDGGAKARATLAAFRNEKARPQ